jgi:putative transposase
MDILQIDHTLMDVEVVDREQRRSIGRPWLTLAIDVASRAVAGFSISLESPSALSVSLVLSHAVLPKAGWLAWSCWPGGHNAADFYSNVLHA